MSDEQTIAASTLETLPIKFSKEVSGFIESVGSATDDFSNNDERWYWIPLYFKKVGENLFEVHVFKDLPDSLKIIAERSLPREENE